MEPFLRPYQQKAVDKMKNGCILNGGVGSGKSRVGLFYYFFKNGGLMDPFYAPMSKNQDLYIITTAMKRDSKEGEAELTYFSMSTNPEASRYDNKIVVDSGNNIKKYIDVKNAFFIFDEQRVTGKGVGVDSFLKISKNNEGILLSATPGDTGSDYIPVFLANGFYKNKTAFAREHIVYSAFTPYQKVERYLNTGRLIRLRNKILVDMDFERPTVQHHEDVYCAYDIKEYKYTIKHKGNPFENKPIENKSELCYILRKIVNSDEHRSIELINILKNHPKAIIFYNFDYERDILLGLLSGILSDYEYGEGNSHAHNPLPFGKKGLYLVQYNAGNEGGNCITTDTIIFFSQNYSYRMTKQAAGRIDRLNTKYIDLYYYHFKSRSGIDLAISKALSKKKNFNEGRGINKSNLEPCRFD